MSINEFNDKYNTQSQKYEGTVWHMTENKFTSSIISIVKPTKYTNVSNLF